MISRWDPFRELAELEDRINQVFGGVWLSRRRDGEPVSARTWEPPVDIYEDEDQLVVMAEIPGVERDNIDIQVTGDTLVISGERKFDEGDGSRNYVRVERTYGPFQRTFTIGVPVKPDEVRASYKDGVLEVVVPKAEETKPKKIHIHVE